MKISSPSLTIFYNLFYFRGFFNSKLISWIFITWNLSIFRPYLAVFSHWIYSTRAGCAPLKLEKIWFFGVKSWFFTRNTPKIFAPPKCAPPNLKSWIRPWVLHCGKICWHWEVRSFFCCFLFVLYMCCLRFEYFQPSTELCFFVHIILLQVCEILFKISMCICSVRIPSLEYSLFTWNLSIFRFNLAVLLPLCQNLLTFRSMIVFLFYRCVICIPKHTN